MNRDIQLNSSAVDSFPESSWVVFVQLEEIVSEGKRYLNRLADPRGLFSVESTLQRCTQRPYVSIAPLLADSLASTCHLNVESIERFTGHKSEAVFFKYIRITPEENAQIILDAVMNQQKVLV